MHVKYSHNGTCSLKWVISNHIHLLNSQFYNLRCRHQHHPTHMDQSHGHEVSLALLPHQPTEIQNPLEGRLTKPHRLCHQTPPSHSPSCSLSPISHFKCFLQNPSAQIHCAITNSITAFSTDQKTDSCSQCGITSSNTPAPYYRTYYKGVLDTAWLPEHSVGTYKCHRSQ